MRCTFFDAPCRLALVKVSVPLAVPVEAGVNAIPIAVDWLGCSVKGRLVCPDRLKPAPVTVMFETVIDVELLFVTCTWLVLVWPTATAPKSTLAGVVSGELEPALGCGAPHPAIRIVSRPNAVANHAPRVRMRSGKMVLRFSRFCFRRGVSKVRGRVLELPGEEKKLGILTCQLLPILIFLRVSIATDRHRSEVDEQDRELQTLLTEALVLPSAGSTVRQH